MTVWACVQKSIVNAYAASPPSAFRSRLRYTVERLARDEVGAVAHAELAVVDDVVAEVARRAAETDLLILGFHRSCRRRAVFSMSGEGANKWIIRLLPSSKSESERTARIVPRLGGPDKR